MKLIFCFLFELIKWVNSGRDGLSRLFGDSHDDQPVGQGGILEQVRQQQLFALLLSDTTVTAADIAARSSGQGRPQGQLFRKVLDQLAFQGSDLVFGEFYKKKEIYCGISLIKK